jgi:hypothetical protein
MQIADMEAEVADHEQKACEARRELTLATTQVVGAKEKLRNAREEYLRVKNALIPEYEETGRDHQIALFVRNRPSSVLLAEARDMGLEDKPEEYRS